MKTKALWLWPLVLLSSGSVFAQSSSSYVFSQAQFATGLVPYSVTVGDFNGDGRLDLAVANADSTNGNSVSILLGKPDGTFAPKVDYATGAAPYAVIAADFNGDGKLDVAVAEPNSNTISILLGNGDGTFQPHVDLPVGQGPHSLVAGDFNHDGKVDLAVANQTDNAVSILLGNGNGTFQPQAQYAANASPLSVAAADFNRDGKLDLAIAGSGGFVTLQGNGDGSFQVPVAQSIAFGYSPVSVVAADFNRDGIADLAVASTRSGYAPEDYVSVLISNGDGTFQSPADYTCVRFVSSIIAADLNSDGKPDIVVGTSYGDPQPLSVLINKGDGTFEGHADYAVGSAPISVAAGDFNGDGKLDLVTANTNDNNVAVLLGSGDGTFQPRTDYMSGNASQGIVAADFNNDGKLDLATADCGSNTGSIFIGNGDGLFQSRMTIATGQCPAAIAAFDFNGDGNIDLVLTNQTDMTLSVLLGNGNGTFQSRIDYALPLAPTGIAVGDFNRDGKLDVAVLNNAIVSVFLGNGDGTFQPRIDSSSGTTYGRAFAIGDVDGDGIPDVAVTDGSYSGTLAVSLGNGDGTFRFIVRYDMPFSPNSIAIADFNRDGKMDLALAQTEYYGFVSILLGYGNGFFQPRTTFATNRYPAFVVAADFDGDGVLDLSVGGSSMSILLGNGDGSFQRHMDVGTPMSGFTTADFDGDGRPDLAMSTGPNFVSVFLNKPAFAPKPSIASISPTSATQGQTIPNFTATGTNFDPNTTLSFSGSGIVVNSYVSRTTTQIVSNITIATNAPLGTQDVIVTNSDSQQGRLPGGVTVLAAPPPTGTINITTNLAAATFTITGPGTFSGSGTGATFSNALVGTYTITYGVVAGYLAPSQQTQTLTAGGTLTFTGTYNLVPSPPSITSIAPISGNRGQTLTVGLTGSNFLPGATLYLFGAAETLSSPVASVSSDGTSATAGVVIPADAVLEPKNVIATNVRSQASQPLPNAFRIYAREFPIFTRTASEPSLAVDPLNPQHAVIGFIDASVSPQNCGWKETIDGGNTWTPNGADGPAGAFPVPIQPPLFRGTSADPWVRFSSNGDLLYSCLSSYTLFGKTYQQSIWLAVSPHMTTGIGGLATTLAVTKHAIATCSTLKPSSQCPAFLDHPAFTTLVSKKGLQVIACWSEFDANNVATLRSASSLGGNPWTRLQGPGQHGRLCTVGGNPTTAAAIWYDDSAGALFWAKTLDAKKWSNPVLLDSAGPLISGSTTDKVLAGPYGLAIRSAIGLRAVYQIRDGNSSKVFVRDLAVGSARIPIGTRTAVFWVFFWTLESCA